ncbi:PQQ-binding-like beta-propeller repeat protein, partial [Streptomyces sp. CC77]|uniref:outer membrane protein assembly factor BamB family protein n=1 Tax=Streptomyces sp. CC77 TaxID=1906739 RepID=UPI000AD6A97F
QPSAPQPPTVAAGPGYGFPQAPGEAPGQPSAPQPPTVAAGPGYGFPQAPGQAPGQPPAYGYPTAPMHQAAPQTPAPGGGLGRKLSLNAKIVLSAAVACALIVGAGFWYSSTKGDDAKPAAQGGSAEAGGGKGEEKGALGGGKEKPPADVKARVGFQVPAPQVKESVTIQGHWLTEKTYVKPHIDGIIGYDPDKGTKRWALPLPGELCWSARHVKDGKTAILFQDAKPTKERKYPGCTEVGVIDLDAGKLLWTKSVEGGTSGDRKMTFDEVTVGGDAVAAGGVHGGAAWDLASGTERWRHQDNTERCRDQGYGGGEALVAVRQCGDYESPVYLVQVLNPADGAPTATYTLPAGADRAAVVSSKPLVVASDIGDSAGDGSGISDYFVIDEKTGKLKAKIAADADRFDGRCREVEGCEKIVVGNGRLYLATEDHQGSGEEYSRVNEIVSFDLATGKPTSDKAEGGQNQSIHPVRMDGSNLIAYREPAYQKGGQIISLDGGSFKETVLLETPQDRNISNAERSLTGRAPMIYQDGRLYLSDTFISDFATNGEVRYTALMFTTKK